MRGMNMIRRFSLIPYAINSLASFSVTSSRAKRSVVETCPPVSGMADGDLEIPPLRFAKFILSKAEGVGMTFANWFVKIGIVHLLGFC